jgi:hypothetical protein
LLFKLYEQNGYVNFCDFRVLFDELTTICVKFLPSLISLKRQKKLNDYTYRLIVSRDLAVTRVLGDWFANNESLNKNEFVLRTLQYGFTSTVQVRSYVHSSFNSLAITTHSRNRAKSIVEIVH